MLHKNVYRIKRAAAPISGCGGFPFGRSWRGFCLEGTWVVSEGKRKTSIWLGVGGEVNLFEHPEHCCSPKGPLQKNKQNDTPKNHPKGWSTPHPKPKWSSSRNSNSQLFLKPTDAPRRRPPQGSGSVPGSAPKLAPPRGSKGAKRRALWMFDLPSTQ